jgi:hypothetical protein
MSQKWLCLILMGVLLPSKVPLGLARVRKPVHDIRYMRTQMDIEMLGAALIGYQCQLKRVKEKIEEIQGKLAGQAAPVESARAPRHRISAAGRARIAAAQRKRWAASKRASAA